MQVLKSFAGLSTFIWDLMAASALGFHRGAMPTRLVKATAFKVGDASSAGDFDAVASRSVQAIVDLRRSLASPPHPSMIRNCRRMQVL